MSGCWRARRGRPRKWPWRFWCAWRPFTEPRRSWTSAARTLTARSTSATPGWPLPSVWPLLAREVRVPTTLNVSGLDEHHWQEWAVPADWAAKAHRQMMAYQQMGCTPTWTCAPYQTEWKPAFGQQIAWAESNAIAFANSVIGARTERYPDLLDICCAITGRVPAVGLHLTENRAGQMLLCASLMFRLRSKPTIAFTRCWVTSWASWLRIGFPSLRG